MIDILDKEIKNVIKLTNEKFLESDSSWLKSKNKEKSSSHFSTSIKVLKFQSLQIHLKSLVWKRSFE